MLISICVGISAFLARFLGHFGHLGFFLCRFSPPYS